VKILGNLYQHDAHTKFYKDPSNRSKVKEAEPWTD